MFRNIGILAHVDAGKTTMTEQLLFTTGTIRELGSVDSGTARTDSMTIERERGISVRSATASVVWKNETINIIDTPGHADFAGEVERCLNALDFAVLVVSAPDGIKAHTENLLRAVSDIDLPRIIFINKLDRAGSDVEGILAELKKLSGRKTVYMSVFAPENEGSETCGILPLDFSKAATEALAEFDSEAEEAFLLDEVLPENKLKAKLCDGILNTSITPVLMGCAKTGLGVRELLDFMISYMPDSTKKSTDSLSGIIFKIEHDKTMGKLSHVRMFGGELSNRDAVAVVSPIANTNTADENDALPAEEESDEKDKISQIKKASGARLTDCGSVSAGDIAVLCGLTKAKVGRYIGTPMKTGSFDLAHPLLRVKVTPADKHPEAVPKLAHALKQLSDEEPYIDAKWENGQSEIVINLTGSIQSEILKALLAERYGIDAIFSPPTVIYKETPIKKACGIGVYTMPKPCWAIVQFMFEPMPRGYGVSYHGRIPNNQLFYRYQSHIHRSFESSLEQGLHGWEVTDFKCTLIGGEHHTIHTHPLDFFVATPMAFMNTLTNCGSQLLEPLLQMRIIAPHDLSGKLISEIVRGGGEYEQPFVRNDIMTLEAIVPFANFMDFPQKLASLSSGKGVLSTRFHGYRECPQGQGSDCPRRGVDPRDTSKWILWARGAMSESQM